MLRWLCLLNFLLTPLLFPGIFPEKNLAVFEADKPATIKVLLEHNIDGALIEVRGPHNIFNPHDGRLLTSRLLGRRYWLGPLSNGLKWGEEFQRVHQIRIMPKNNRTTILVNGIQYRGCLDAYLINDKISLVNEVDIENYLKSTLTAKYPKSRHDEVMDALIIAARTDTYFTAMNHEKAYWHVKADEVGYQGLGVTLLSSEVDRAVDSTRHLIMLYKGKPFPTSWSDNCAGKTASYKTVYRKNVETPEGVVIPVSEKERKNFHWTFSMGKDELAKILRTPHLNGLELYTDKDSQKVYGLRLDTGDQSRDLEFSRLQKAIGEKKLISNDFTVKLDKDKVLFSGYGRGDGVGLCLYSAGKFASKGELAPKILTHFYPNTHVEKVRSFEQLSQERVKQLEPIRLK